MFQLKKIIGNINDVVIVSDRHKSIVKAVELVLPNVFHCICLVHLLWNIKHRYKEKPVDSTFFFLCKSFQHCGF